MKGFYRVEATLFHNLMVVLAYGCGVLSTVRGLLRVLYSFRHPSIVNSISGEMTCGDKLPLSRPCPVLPECDINPQSRALAPSEPN